MSHPSHIAAMLADYEPTGDFTDPLCRHSCSVINRAAPNTANPSLWYPADPNGHALVSRAMAGWWHAPCFLNTAWLCLPLAALALVLAIFGIYPWVTGFLVPFFLAGHIGLMILGTRILSTSEDRIKPRLATLLPLRKYAPFGATPDLKTHTILIQNHTAPTSPYRTEPFDVGVVVLDPAHKCVIIEGLRYRQVVCKPGFIGINPDNNGLPRVVLAYTIGNTRVNLALYLLDFPPGFSNTQRVEAAKQIETEFCEAVTRVFV